MLAQRGMGAQWGSYCDCSNEQQLMEPTIEQAAKALRNHKSSMESQITLLLKKFVEETGIGINDITLEAYDKQLPSGSVISMPCFVSINLEFKK